VGWKVLKILKCLEYRPIPILVELSIAFFLLAHFVINGGDSKTSSALLWLATH
jgi:hypothetical protein